MDEKYIEQAIEHQDHMLDLTIRRIQKDKQLKASGLCLNCNEPLPKFSNKRWCDADCRDDWERLNRRKK